jgi:hypothetical protein
VAKPRPPLAWLLEEAEGAQRAAGRALHRQVASSLSAAILQLHLLAREPPQALAAAAATALPRALAVLEAGAQSLREIELGLRPPLLDEGGLATPLRWLAEREGVALAMPPRLPRLGAEREWQVYRGIELLVRRGVRGLRRIEIDGDLVVRISGKPTPDFARTTAALRARLPGAVSVRRGEVRIRARRSART